ncbi:MAG TPA: ribonuclease P protein component [Candidatus Paceibacterota bacterium]|nr:ribonuclease P protein component [Candidatus Paceibacterota bacterium]
MLPKNRRLNAREVAEVLAKGRSARATYLSAKQLPGTVPFRASAVVSKKVAKRAVERNRLRRALYRALQDIKGSGTHVVFVQKIPPAPLTTHFREDLLVLTASKN